MSDYQIIITSLLAGFSGGLLSSLLCIKYLMTVNQEPLVEEPKTKTIDLDLGGMFNGRNAEEES